MTRNTDIANPIFFEEGKSFGETIVRLFANIVDLATRCNLFEGLFSG